MESADIKVAERDFLGNFCEAERITASIDLSN